MSTTDHKYPLLMLEGCKHQGQTIIPGIDSQWHENKLEKEYWGSQSAGLCWKMYNSQTGQVAKQCV